MSAAGAGAPSRRGRRVSFIGIFVVTFCGVIAIGAVLPVLPRYVHGPLNKGDIAVGIVIGAYAVTGLLLRPIAGRLADTRGRRATVLLGSLLLVASGLLYLPSLGLAGLIVARLVTGAGEGGVYTAGSTWIIDLAPVARRGQILGLYGLSVWGALSVGPLAGELILDLGGYRAVWLFAAAMPMLGALIASLIPDPFRPRRRANPHPLIATEAVLPGAAIALAALGYATVAAFIVLHLDSLGVGHGATVFAAFAATIVLARLFAGHLPDRRGPTAIAVGATLGEAAGLLLIALAQGLPIAILGGVLMGGAFSLLTPSLMLIAVGSVSQSARGAAMGTFTAFFDLGIGIGAPLAGAVAALAGYGGAFFFAAAVAACSAALILITMHRRPEAAAAG